MTYAEYKLIVPNSKVKEADYSYLFDLSKEALRGYIVLGFIESYLDNPAVMRAIAYQIDYFDKEGISNEGITSESVTGISVSRNIKGYKGEFNTCLLSTQIIKNAGLSVLQT